MSTPLLAESAEGAMTSANWEMAQPAPAPKVIAWSQQVGTPSRTFWIAASVLLLIGAFALDCVSGDEVSSSLFYVVCVGAAGWFLGERAGLLFSGLSAVAWGIAVAVVGPGFSRPEVFYWNFGVELAVYGTIASAFARIHRGALRQRDLTARLAIAHDALDREAKAVGALQREMLPEHVPEVAGYEWQLEYRTSTHAGGDYYDFLPLPDGRWGVMVSDASGHGPQASILMAMLRVLLRTSREAPASPARVLTTLNRQVVRTVPSGRFATACYLVLEPRTGRVEFSLAGHPAPLLQRTHGRPLEQLPLCGGPPLGLFHDAVFESGTATLREGDTLILYTDGLTEGVNAANEMFEESRLQFAIKAQTGRSLEGMLAGLLDHFDRHAAGTPLADDLTLLLLRRQT